MIVLVVLTLPGCHSSRSVSRGRGETVSAADADHRGSVDRAHGRKIVEHARSWLGTPYRYGGNDRRGVDCSGLTCNVYSSAAGVKLPRDSRSQKDFCRKISRSALQEGDLVFFTGKRGSNKVNHVGIYVGDGRMIHASSSRGVMVSDFTTGYWGERYYASGRVDAVTYRWLGTEPPAVKKPNTQPSTSSKPKKEKKAKKQKEKKAKNAKGRGGATVSGALAQPAVRTIEIMEVHVDSLSTVLTPPAPLPATPPPVQPEPSPAPAPEPDEGGGWFD